MITDKSALQFENMLNEGRNITIISHFNPDGDAVGSSTGLKGFISSMGKTANIILPSHIPSYLKFLDPENAICYYKNNPGKAQRIISESDLLICLDFNNLKRTEWMAEDIASSSAKKILIDHHLSPETEYFDLIFSDISVSSTCELLYWIILQTPSIKNDIQKLSRETIESLATGLITDTNNFNNSTSSKTFLMASQIMDAGIDLVEINDIVFKNFSENRMRLMGHLLLDSMKFVHNGYASYIILTLEDKEKYNFKDGDSEGFVNLPLSISGLEISAFFSECDGYVRVSMRSKGEQSVNDFCRQYFNGGGHKKASGGRLYIPIEEVPEYYTKSLEQFLQQKK